MGQGSKRARQGKDAKRDWGKETKRARREAKQGGNEDIKLRIMRETFQEWKTEQGMKRTGRQQFNGENEQNEEG